MLSAVCLGSGHVCARYTFGLGVELLTAASVRAGCACLVLLTLVLARRTVWRVPGRHLAGCGLLGVCVVGQTLFVQIGVKRLPVTLALLLFYTYPFFTALASSLLGDHKVERRLALSLAAAFAGLLLVLGVSPQAVDPVGVAAAVGAALSFTGTLVLTPRLAPGMDPPLRTLLMMAAAALLIGTATAATGGLHWPAAPAAQAGLLGLSLLYGVGITGVFLMVSRLGPVPAAVVLNLEPVFVATIAWIALGEALTAVQVMGAAVVVGAVVFSQARRAG